MTEFETISKFEEKMNQSIPLILEHQLFVNKCLKAILLDLASIRLQLKNLEKSDD